MIARLRRVGHAQVPPHRAGLDGRTRCTPASACCSTRASTRAGRVTTLAAVRSRTGLEKLGLTLFAEEGHRLPELTTAWLPDGGSTRPRCGAGCSTDYGIEIGCRGRRRSRARCGASAAWATPPGRATSRFCSRALEEVLGRLTLGRRPGARPAVDQRRAVHGRPRHRRRSTSCVRRSIDEPEWFWDAVGALPRPPLRLAVRAGARHVERHRRGRDGSPAAR